MQFIIIIKDDEGKYIQASRRRFLSKSDADNYKHFIAPSRDPISIAVKEITLDKHNYPINNSPYNP